MIALTTVRTNEKIHFNMSYLGRIKRSYLVVRPTTIHQRDNRTEIPYLEAYFYYDGAYHPFSDFDEVAMIG